MTTTEIATGAALALSSFTAAGPETLAWNVDAPHTAVTFSVKHFFTPVKGQFDRFDVALTFDREDPENSTVRVRIPVASINTGNEKRNAHLMSEDFFEADSHPEITFVSERVRQTSHDQLLVTGLLTIKGVSRTVDLPVTVLGITDLPPDMQQMFGGIEQVASFEAKLSLDRRDFGVGVGSWAATAVVGSNVDITLAVEANR